MYDTQRLSHTTWDCKYHLITLYPAISQFCQRFLTDIATLVKFQPKIRVNRQAGSVFFRRENPKIEAGVGPGYPENSMLSLCKSQDVIQRPKKVRFFTILTL